MIIENTLGKRREVPVPNNLKNIRLEKGLTQNELAAMLNITVSYLSKIENEKKLPNVLLAIRLANALDCNVEDIFFIPKRDK